MADHVVRTRTDARHARPHARGAKPRRRSRRPSARHAQRTRDKPVDHMQRRSAGAARRRERRRMQRRRCCAAAQPDPAKSRRPREGGGARRQGRHLALLQVSRNSIGNLTPRRKTGFRKFPWKSDPFRNNPDPVPPRLTPRDPSEPRDAPEGERKFAISGAKKSKSWKNCALCAAKKTPNPAHIGIEPPTTLKVKT